MKKLLTLVLAIAMIATMSVTAFAADVTQDGGSATIDVTGTFEAAQGAGDKISVDISWDAMEFTYTEGAKGEWLPGEHKYADNAAGSWSADTATITVKNHSNVAVTATLAFAPSVEGVIGTFTESSGTENDNVLALASAAEGEALGNFDKAPTAAAKFGISGAGITQDTNLGTITVSIAKDTQSTGGGQ